MSLNGLKQINHLKFCNWLYSHSAEDTIAFGQQVGRIAHPGTIICLFGNLGSGKTTLIKGIISSITDRTIEEICSPTFTYLNIYEGKCPVYHFDLYRLKDADDFLSLGFEEYLFGNGVCCLEWSEKITPLLPDTIHKIQLSYCDNDCRKIFYEISSC